MLRKTLERLGLFDWAGPTPLGVIVIFGAIIAALVASAVGMDAAACGQYGETTGRATTYRFPSGCYVASRGGFIPADEFRARAVTNEAP